MRTLARLPQPADDPAEPAGLGEGLPASDGRSRTEAPSGPARAMTMRAPRPTTMSRRRDGRAAGAWRTAVVSTAGVTANSSIGSAMPLSFGRPRDRKVSGRLVRTSERTVSETRTSPGAATAQIRAAMLTAEPTKPSPSATDSPAWTPTPTRIGRSARAALARAASATMASPHRTAAPTLEKTM